MVAAVLATIVLAAGCGGGSPEAKSERSGSGSARIADPAQVKAALASGAVALDVRTPAEFGTGHLPGAENIDVQSPDFDARVATLDREKTYVVYCRSGSRATTAVQRMAGLGFTKLINGGGFAQLAPIAGTS